MYQKIEKMIKDLELRGRSNDTIKNRVYIIENFSRFYNKSPELLGEHEIINYLGYCIKTRKLLENNLKAEVYVSINLFLKNIKNKLTD